MAFRPLLQQRAIPAAVAAVAGMAVYAPRQLHAEEPFSSPSDMSSQHERKPIYDDIPLNTLTPVNAPSTTPSLQNPSTSQNPTAPAEPYRPTPTDRLAVQIGHARLALYNQATKAEDRVNAALTSTLRLEHSFTSTLRSLAPPKESGEKLFPGALYVLVASMAGSIVTRNRNILLRATVPAAIGIGAAYAVLPITMRNVGDLVWTYEKRYPVLADAHLRTKARVEHFFETGKAHTRMGVAMVEEKVGDTRERLEEWVRKGR